MTHDLRLGVEEMDRVHEAYLDLLKGLQEKQGVDLELFAQLIEETKSHFLQEEKLMMKHLYPEREMHTEDHVQLIDEMESFFKMAATMPPMARSFIDSYAYDKFRRHTMFYDLDLAKHLHSAQEAQ
ncbi:MAG: hemerythrin family protein [Campylobacterales bacterium]